MICFLTKWFISHSLDSDKKIPFVFRRHIQKCKTCQKFQNLCQTIHERAAQETDSVLQEIPPHLSERMKSKISYDRRPKKEIRRRKILIPIASTMVLFILAAILVFYHPLKRPYSKKGETDIPVLNTFYETGEGLQNLTAQIGFHYETEFNSLKKAVQSASQYLIKKLDFNINSSKEESPI